MKKILFLINVLLLSFAGIAQCPVPPTCTYTAVNGTNYTVNAGETLCIKSPLNYNSGTITMNGGTLYVENGATLSKNVLPSTSSTINVCGTLASNIQFNDKATLNYYGSNNVSIDMRNGLIMNNYSTTANISFNTLDNVNIKTFNNYGTTLSLSVSQWNQPLTINNIGGNLTVTSAPTVKSGSVINNASSGTLTWQPSMTAEVGVIINNASASTLNLSTSGNANSPTITNNGNFNVSGDFYIASGGSINNNSNMNFSAQLRLDGGTVNNNANSTMTVKTLYGNSGTFNMGNQSVLNIIDKVTVWDTTPINLTSGCASIFTSTNASTINNPLLNNQNLNFCGATPIQSGGSNTTITSISDNGSDTYRIVGNFPNGLNNLDYIYITGVTGVSNLNGYWRVNKINATTFDLIGSDFTSGAIISSSNILYEQGKLKLGTGNYLGYSGCANACVPLPIKIIYFTVTKEERVNKVSWKIVNNELDIQSYEVEKSNDALNFFKIDGYSNRTGQNDYYAYDNKPYNPTTYYRIKTLYKNGTFDYSIIRYSENDVNDLVVYPNPSNGAVFVYYNNIVSYKMSIVDINGTNISYTSEMNYNFAKVLDLQKGVYIINIYTDTELIHKKIIIY